MSPHARALLCSVLLITTSLGCTKDPVQDDSHDPAPGLKRGL